MKTPYDALVNSQPGLRTEEQDELNAARTERPDARARRGRLARIGTLRRRITTARYSMQTAAQKGALSPLDRALTYSPDTADLDQIAATLTALGV